MRREGEHEFIGMDDLGGEGMSGRESYCIKKERRPNLEISRLRLDNSQLFSTREQQQRDLQRLTLKVNKVFPVYY